MDKQIIITMISLFCLILLFEFSNLDIIVQDLFYNFASNQWLLDRNEKVIKFILYDGFKKAYIIFILLLLSALILFRKNQVLQEYHSGLLIVLISTCLVPLVVGGLKATTNTPCPRQINHYHGNYPYVKVLAKYPQGFHQTKKAKCYPAGHASAGFALLSLYFLFKKKRNRIIALSSALITGWITGAYKMLIGDHFLSHTVVTMVLAWLIILLVARNVYRPSGPNN